MCPSFAPHPTYRHGDASTERRAVGVSRHAFPAPADAMAPTAATPEEGRQLPVALRQKMEAGLGARFDKVRLHESVHPAQLGADAYTQGEHIHLRPGQLAGSWDGGERLIGHELVHVLQQRAGRVGFERPDSPVVENRGLEAEADQLGHRVAEGGTARLPMMSGPTGAAPAGSLAGASEMAGGPSPIQMGGDDDKQTAMFKNAAFMAETMMGLGVALTYNNPIARALRYRAPNVSNLLANNNVASGTGAAIEAGGLPVNVGVGLMTAAHGRPKTRAQTAFAISSAAGLAGGGLGAWELAARFLPKAEHAMPRNAAALGRAFLVAQVASLLAGNYWARKGK